jgi:DNA-binding transcriptional regulator GbsR (MarR family)
MDAKLLRTEKEFIDRMGKISKRWGMGEPAGRVWGVLLFSDAPLSQKEIAEKTGYTLSLVSPSLKIIEKYNMARSVRSGSKEKSYESTTSFIDGFNILIKQFLEQDIKPLIKELEDTQTAKKNKKLSQLISDYKRLERYLCLFEKMRMVKKCISGKCIGGK